MQPILPRILPQAFRHPVYPCIDFLYRNILQKPAMATFGRMLEEFHLGDSSQIPSQVLKAESSSGKERNATVDYVDHSWLRLGS